MFFCACLSFILHFGTVDKGDDVRSGADAVGLKETVAVALSYTGLASPHDGVIVGVANNVGKGIFNVHRRLALVAPKEGHKLRPRADIEGAEGTVVKACGDALLGCPKYRLVVMDECALVGDVGEVVYAAFGFGGSLRHAKGR